MAESGLQFLHEQNRELHHSREVEDVANYLRAGGETIPNQPADKIQAHLGFLANREYVNDGILTGDQSSIDRQIDAHVIKAEDVPESYFELQRRIARERGHGDIEITSDMRRQHTEAIQADQKSSLSKWVEYIGAENYPDWFKTYIWNSVVRLGQYDKDKDEFGKRNSGTTAAYPDLNREALAYVFDALQKGRIENQPAEDERLQKLLQTANFGKLYIHALHEVSPPPESLRQDIRGSWTKFDQTTDPRVARRLSNSLQGHGTGWCTAGESTAAVQLQGGDFYVYYTRDEEDQETIPRVAIRMENGKVAEVRGINAEQELEPELAGITLERLKDLPGGEAYAKKAEDMKLLTTLEKRLRADPHSELSKDEVKFLYEMEHTIEGFGYGHNRDPRIDELKANRGELDHPAFKELAIERVREGFEASYRAYQQVCENLGVPARLEAELKQLYEAKLQEWTESGVLDYVAERRISHGELYTPVISPEGLFDYEQIATLVEKFAEGQWKSLWDGLSFDRETKRMQLVHQRRLYSLYSAQELSGSGELHVSLIPSTLDDGLSGENIEDQKRALADLQTENPTLSLRVPSVLDSISYWFALRSGGGKLEDDTAVDKTRIPHFDLEPKRIHPRYGGPDLDVTPVTYVDTDARPYLYEESTSGHAPVRLALG